MNEREWHTVNKRDWIVLSILVNHGYTGQRDIVRRAGYSIGLVSTALRKLVEEGYVDDEFNITAKTHEHIERSRPRRAVILAAGMGLRMIPISKVPKGLLKVNDEPLIERIIKQLAHVGVSDITIVTGFMTEKLDYLIDKFGVNLVYDAEYTRRDSLQSLSLVSDKLSNCYVVPSNVWFSRNPFHHQEFFSWYAVSEYIDDDSYLRLNRKLELVYTDDEHGGNSMVGLGYLLEPEAVKLKKQLKALSKPRKYHKAQWERALFDASGSKLITYARVMQGQSTYEINTYEQLRELDSESKDLRSKRIDLIAKVFDVHPERITDISRLFKGMTNRLMRFSVDDAPYLMRVPGEGSNELTNRSQEADVYNLVKDTGLTEKLVYISPADGHKITQFLEGSRICDPENDNDVAACMRHLRKLHELKLEIAHKFDMLERIEVYEKLRGEQSSFEDYDKVRGNIFEMLGALARKPQEHILCHADPVYDNFLLVGNKVYLIDWEYAGMCEAQVDLAMACLYADYSKERVDWLIDTYYDGKATPLDRFKVYAYASAAGLLWAIWCEYKEKMGVTFGEYAMRQWRYAKRFHKYAMRLAEECEIFAKR